jgi:molybdenum cofactor guanylyltransferase
LGDGSVSDYMRNTKISEGILGAVLAGGRSRRFGSDKALATAGNSSLLDLAAASLEDIADAVVVCGRVAEGWTSLPDRPRPDMGPLGGLNAALHYAAAHGYRAVISTACDIPALPQDMLRALPGEGAAVLSGQHLVGYWPSALAEALDSHLAASEDRSLLAWIARIGARVVDTAGIVIPNINRPIDLADWEGRTESG